MTLSRLLVDFPNLPNVWGEGALFAFSGIDGETNAASGFVATLAGDAYGLLFHTPCRRLLDISIGEAGTLRIVAGDVYAVETGQGNLIVAFSTWHTLIGVLPPAARLLLRLEDGPDVDRQGGVSVSADAQGRDVLVLTEQAGRFALSYGQSVEQARQRAAEGLARDLFREVRKRLAFYRDVPSLESPADDRLLKKCASVMKANTLAAEGSIRQEWSTPDRVPHRDMWLWDSVFHSLGMNGLRPRLAWHFLKSVLDTQGKDGMISHHARPSGWRSAITQPPLLAWGVWENHQTLRDKVCLSYALPRLERYLDWDCAHRDRNQNGLLEWFIEEDANCRSGESGMDNSPRFDRAMLLDAVDFSAFAARDMAYTASIAEELGETEKARLWRRRSRAMSEKVHSYLWDERDGFYYDRDMDGRHSRVRAVSGIFALLLDDVPPERVDRLVQVLKDPEWFNAPFPAPSVALCEPTWSTDMWRGATWVNTNYLIILGLAQHGRAEEAAWLAEKTIGYVRKYYEQFGVLFEFFDASDDVPPSACNRKGPRVEPYDIRRKMDSIRDYHWTAALTARLLLDRATAI
jgi:glycogen debranching enzyme